MTPLQGVAFLLVGVGIFVGGIFYLIARERLGRRPTRTVHHFQRSRSAMRKLYRAQLARREAALQRARSSHPAGHRKHRRSA